jgi:Ser/Thr protein kinase RdoA (MazF antagonist)
MAQTHVLLNQGGVLVKRYTSWDRGEHRREWTVLRHLHAHVPGLVPEPLGADLEAAPPSLTMTELPGTPLDGPLSQAQLDALKVALQRLWSVPANGLPPRRYHPGEAWAVARSSFEAAARPSGLAGEAFDAVRAHMRRPGLADTAETVVGHSDSNLANYLWDGELVRIVDFEDAGRSDRAYELACLIEHFSARPTGWGSFLDAFDIDRDRLSQARILFAALWFFWLLPGNIAARRNPPETLHVQAERLLELIG